ncbi:hypothetical protein CKM354_000826700 [Cercospora kikuchii]|uniref:Uncharacterized protein n=1 Tax=Cercospora kikuchii TaxID=84275 RepID=A0A9P3CIK8_9PEZI|nr:uncharacterized protein CKM354_000826700 [Cercospora kikuchii]GIZ45084.1 hypothetical protein CKM354_000826700 [Cercospora kikuchii]
MHFFSIIALAAGIRAAVLGVSNLEAETETHLISRDVPPCPKCPISDQDWQSKFKPGNPGAPEDQSKTYPAGWKPRAASTHGYVCYDLAKGITFRGGGGITPRYGAWKRSDGTQIMCWLYWQHVLQFTGNGVVFNSYPAHCTVFIHIDNQLPLIWSTPEAIIVEKAFAFSIISANVVLDDGTLVTADQQTHPDLLRALKGGGAHNFGVVARVTIKLYPCDGMWGGMQIVFDNSFPDLFEAIGCYAKNLARDGKANLIVDGVHHNDPARFKDTELIALV